MGKFLTKREPGPNKLDHERNATKAVERAELMSTGELITWTESISATIATQCGTYAASRGDPSLLEEARLQAEVLHGILTVLISRP